MGEEEMMRELIRRGEERLARSRSTLLKLKSAESEASSILGQGPSRRKKTNSSGD